MFTTNAAMEVEARARSSDSPALSIQLIGENSAALSLQAYSGAPRSRHGNGPLHQGRLTAAKTGRHDLQRSSHTSHHVDTQHTLCLHESRRRGPRMVPMSKPHGQAKPARNAGALTDQIDAAHAPYRHPDNSSSSSSSPRAINRSAGKPDRVTTLGQPPSRPGRDAHPESPVPLPRDRWAIDQFGQVIDVLVCEKRDLAATRRFSLVP
jgi:hypothetical protein